MTRFISLFSVLCFLLALLVGGTACAGPGQRSKTSSTAVPDAPKMILFRDYRSHLRLGLANDGMLFAQGYEGDTPELRRASYYSSRNTDLSIKITSDALLAGLIEYIEGQGFKEYAHDGPAPPESVTDSRLTTSIEISIDGHSRTWMFDVGWLGMNPPPKEMKGYIQARAVFLEAQKEIDQYATGSLDDWGSAGGTLKKTGGR